MACIVPRGVPLKVQRPASSSDRIIRPVLRVELPGADAKVETFR